MPAGGTTGDTLVKQSATDYDTAWEPPKGAIPIGGEITYYGTTEPAGGDWLFPNGQEISRTDYAEFFEMVGTTHGVGDGVTTFNMPDARGTTPVMVAGAGAFTTLWAIVGAEQVTLTIGETPAHVHDAGTLDADAVGNHTHGSGSYSAVAVANHTHPAGGLTIRLADGPTGGTVNAWRAQNFAGTSSSPIGGNTGAAGGHGHTISGSSAAAGGHGHNISGDTGSAGGGDPHDNIQPSMVVNKLVRVR